MESEKIKGGDSSLPVTYMLSDGCDPVLTTGSPEATEFIRMSHVSEEGVEEEEEENEEGQEEDEEEELTFLLVMDQDQIWDNLCDPVEGERSEQLERGQRDPENWAERKSSPNLPGNNSEAVSLNCHQEELAAANSQSVHQPSLFNSSTLALALAPRVIAGKGQLSVGLPQALNVHDTSPQTQCEETLKTSTFLAQAESTYECCQESRDISKGLQNAESSKPRSDEDLPLHPETSHEKEKGLLVVVEAHEEMSSKMEGTGRMDPSPSSTEKEVRELKEQGEDVKPFADQPSSEFPEGSRRKADGVQMTPNGLLPLLSSEEVDNHLGLAVKVEDLEQNVFLCSDQQLREEDDTEEGRAGSLTETKPAESRRDGGEVELAQEWLLKTVASEPADMEVMELGDTELDGEEDLDWKEMEKEMKMEQEKLFLGADAHEGQEMQAQKTSNEGMESETAAPPFMLGLDITFPHKELFASDSSPESACAECCIQTSVAEQMPSAGPPAEGLTPASESPRAQSPTCQGQWEYSGIYYQAGCVPCSGQDCEQPTEGGRKGSVEEECRENDGDGKCARRVNGEGTAPFSRDLLLTPKSQNLNDFQGMNLPVDGEIRILASPLETVTAAGLQQKDACKSDGTVGYVVLHEEPDSKQELPKQNVPLPCQLNKTVSGEASVFGSDETVQSAHKKDVSSRDSHERAQDSASEVLQSVLPEEGLEEESIKPGLVVQDETWDLVSAQAQDRAMDKFQKHLKPPMRNFVFPGKEAEEDLFCTDQEILISELPCFLGPEENRAENKHNPSPDRGMSTATDTAELTKPLTPGPDLDHTLDSDLPSSHLHQTSSSPLDCRHSLPFLASLPNSDFLAQPPDPDMDPTHPSQILEQLPSSCPTCPFLSLLPVSTQMPQSVATTSASDQPPASESGFHPCCQLPDCACNSKQSLSLEDDVVPVLPPKRKHFVLPALHTNQGSQTLPSGQIREAEALEFHTSPPPVFPLTADPQNLPLHCHYSKSPAPGSKLFAQQQAEAPKSSLPIRCREANGHARTSVPIASSTSQDTPPALESQHFKPVLNTDGGVEELSLVQLAELQEGNAPGDQKHNIQGASSNLEVGVLGTHSNLVTLNNDASIVNPIYGILEPTARVTDVPDGTAPSDLISVESHTPEVQDSVRPPLLAFTNPIHFLQLGPPSPPTARHPYRQQAVFHGSQRRQQQQQQTDSAKIDAGLTSASAMMLGVAEVAGKFRKGLEKPTVETIPAEVQWKEGLAKRQPLEKSSSCPPKNVIRQDMKESETNSRRQEVLPKLRSKSKDWHRQGLRKVSISTDHALGSRRPEMCATEYLLLPVEAIASLVPSKEEVPAYKDKREHSDQVTYGEKKPAETFDVFIKRRCSKLIHSSELLYQKYSDDALNKAIQNQKRAGSVPEDVELGSPNSPRLRRKGLHSQDSYLHRLSVSSSTSLWQDIPMVRGSTMLLSMTHEEQKLQEAKFELIASEASYLRSLNVAVDHFQCSQALQAVLNNQEKQWLFSRLPDVRDVSANFLFDLEEKLEENMFNFNVCDVALRHAPEFRRVYLPYVTNQTYQQQTFRRLLNDIPAFQQVLEKLESDPVCQRLSLKSFLILPFQRITRLKLLLQNILKRTPPGADEEMQATQAYDALEKLIKDCNENVQRMKSTEELIYLSQNMEFECKIFPLISQSRRLIKCGELTALEYNISLKWKLTTRPIYLHLFNDYLLLSRPRENGRFIVFDYAASSDVRGEKCEMKLHGANKNVFRLFLLQNSQGKKVEFLFRTETQSEKLRWISALAPRQAELDLLDDSDALQVQCVKPYKARENDELALEKADIIMVLQQSTDGWSEGIKLSDGERGWFPSEQVETIASKEARQINLKEQLRVKKAKQQVFHRR